MSKVHANTNEHKMDHFVEADWLKYHDLQRKDQVLEADARRHGRELPGQRFGSGKHHDKAQFRRHYMDALQKALKSRPHNTGSLSAAEFNKLRNGAASAVKLEDTLRDVWQRRMEIVRQHREPDPAHPPHSLEAHLHYSPDARFYRWTEPDFRRHVLRLAHELPTPIRPEEIPGMIRSEIYTSRIYGQGTAAGLTHDQNRVVEAFLNERLRQGVHENWSQRPYLDHETRLTYAGVTEPFGFPQGMR